MMIISFRGRKSGKAYSTPVNYFLAPGEQGEYLVTFGKPERVWWRNLRDGAQITLCLKGNTVRGQATASYRFTPGIRMGAGAGLCTKHHSRRFLPACPEGDWRIIHETLNIFSEWTV
ncbi:MAG TPA: hypothetical protein VLM80_02115 [Anaerolineales bacterium]|nr:hypothetical protein [Anaerolineales bacterium]